MSSIRGYYYCINGCLKYPLSNSKIIELVKYITENGIIDKAEYYDINRSHFNYDSAMNGYFIVNEQLNFSLTENFPHAIICLEFDSFDIPCRLLVEYLDNDYYAISLLFSSEVLISDKIKDKMIIPFYKIIKPLYGTNGIEKAVFSLNQITAEDADIFNSEFMLNNDICEKIGINHLKKAKSAIALDDVGIYFTKRKKAVSKLIFHKFIQYKE